MNGGAVKSGLGAVSELEKAKIIKGRGLLYYWCRCLKVIVSDKKRQTIKESLNATREKRKCQRCRVFELKITGAKMSRAQREHLQRLFLEAKWFYNHVLSQEDIFNADTKVKSVPVKCGDVFEERSLLALSSQMKQSLANRVETAIR